MLSSGLENRCTGNRTLGSNPTLSAPTDCCIRDCGRFLILHYPLRYPLGGPRRPCSTKPGARCGTPKGATSTYDKVTYSTETYSEKGEHHGAQAAFRSRACGAHCRW